jgi:F-type H+-transporting ATPase subunit epsilon
MKLEVVTPKGTAVEADVDEVTAPGLAGEFGVLPGHTPFLTALKPGRLSWRGRGGEGTLTIGAGFCEVDGKDRVIVLTQSADRSAAAEHPLVT